MLLWNSLLLGAGILLLNFGAAIMVKGAARLAKSLGVRPMIIGLTIVAFGTSAPEFVVSLFAALKHQSGIAIGNIVGSNIANIGLILGLSAVIAPLHVAKNVIRKQLWILLGATVMLLAFGFDGEFTRVEGVVFGVSGILFLADIIYNAKRGINGFPDYSAEIPAEPSNLWRDLGAIVFGLVALLFGSQLVVDAGVGMMRILGISETVIGLTIIAIGTSLPELATSVVSAIKRESEISVGNVIGSNIFNTLFILGSVSSLGDIGFEQKLISFQLWLLLGMTALLFPILNSQRQVDKKEGVFLLMIYVCFMYFVIFNPNLTF